MQRSIKNFTDVNQAHVKVGWCWPAGCQAVRLDQGLGSTRHVQVPLRLPTPAGGLRATALSHAALHACWAAEQPACEPPAGPSPVYWPTHHSSVLLVLHLPPSWPQVLASALEGEYKEHRAAMQEQEDEDEGEEGR